MTGNFILAIAVSLTFAAGPAHAGSIEIADQQKIVPESNDGRITVRVTLDGAGNLTWNGERLAGLDELATKFAELSGLEPQPVAFVRPAKDAHFSQLTEVFKLMQHYKIGFGDGMVGNMRPDP